MPKQIKKKLAVFFNTSELGGAERSMLQQLLRMRDKFQVHCFVPGDSHASLGQALKTEKYSVMPYVMPTLFYQFSRKSRIFSMLKMVFGLGSLFFTTKNKQRLDEADILYANGNKSAIFLLTLMLCKNIKKPMIWHWRDYPPEGPNGKIFRNILNVIMKIKEVEFVANSYSVEKKLNQFFPHTKSCTIYNFAGNNPAESEPREICEIGVVSMLAPWKGLHVLILFFHLYEEKLKKIGIRKVKIYGAQIYSTLGEHTAYSTQLKKLLEKFPTSILSFQGLQSPQKIYQEIDLLIHYSLQPEPFGRVIAEAFWAKIPVISTATGGASELITEATGAKVFPHDFEGLFLEIKKLVDSPRLRQNQVKNSFELIKQLEHSSQSKLQELIEKFA